ncbi:MAG: prolyl oligopeptidase family serine peptidase [Bacteroidaceae bacterium]|nr:prolyl oligopeptidase family serine peptidase [Bacteroidaceae bacterium]
MNYRFSSTFIGVCLLMGQGAMAQKIQDNWWFGQRNDSVAGINVKGMKEFIGSKNLKPATIPVYSVIDGGFDMTHPYIKDVVRDTLGWNFLGNAKESFDRAGTEAYRQFKRLHPKYKNVKDAKAVTDTAEYKYYLQMANEIHIQSYLMMAWNHEYTYKAVHTVDSLMKLCYGNKKTHLSDFMTIDVADTTGLMGDIETTYSYCVRYTPETSWDSIVSVIKADYELSHKRVASLDKDDDPHHKLGNDFDDFRNLHYGNADITSDAYHGTMVSGLIATMLRNASLHGVQIPVRAIPDGDEYDRDVVAAIRWAVDNGAKVVNMSFGKKHSPHADKVKEAIQYALDHDVLLIHAAGNDGRDNDKFPIYPTPFRTGEKERWDNMVVVAASDIDGKLAGISCYGKNSVDIMAPGMAITSCKPGGTYDTQRGTSLSAPIVSGLAVVIRSYFPDLTAKEVRDILVSTANNNIVDALAAFEKAWSMSRYGDGIFYQAEKMTSDSIYNLMTNKSMSVTFLPDGRYVHFTREDNGQETPTHYLIDTKQGKEIRLFSDPKYRYLSDMHITRDGKAFAFRAKGKPMQYNWATKLMAESTDTLKAEHHQFGPRGDYRRNYSADSLYYVTAIGHDMWLYDTQKGDSVRLTDNGKYLSSYATGGNSTSDNVKPGERGSALGSWIGNTHRYICIREDKSNVGKMTIVNNLANPRPKAVTYPFPMPGDDKVGVFHSYLLDADKREMKEINLTEREDDMIEIPRFTPLAQSGNYVYALQKSRYQDTITLWRIDGEHCEIKPIIRETVSPHLCEQLFSFHPLNKGRDILWWSERTGRGRYYLYDGEGNLKNAITPDNMIAGQIVRIDTLGRSLILEGYGREKHDCNPAYKYYYRCSFNGKQTVCLTPKAGHHSATFNKDYTLVFDNCSSIDKAPVYSIYNTKGKEIAVIGKADDSKMKASGRNLPQSVKVMSADGKTPIWGVVYTPWWMKADDKLPVITNPYPGPHTDLVPLGYEINDNGNQTLADLGFVVICFSYRGTCPWRGRDFYTYGYQNLRDYAIDDDMAAIRQLPAIVPQADTTRVGIYGHSGGGFMTVAAMLQHPDFYKVGVAASGNHDNNIYTKWWGETFHGRGRIPTNIEIAQNLNGRLLLIHGDMDNNVHPANTIRMANALIKQGKTFDMLIIPGQDHGLGDKYYMNRIRYYMMEHLSNHKFNHIDILNHK